MKSALEAIRARALERLQNAEDLTALEEARVQLLGKKGELTAILKTMGQLSPEERPVMGQMANEVRAAIEEKIETVRTELKEKALEARLPAVPRSRPPWPSRSSKWRPSMSPCPANPSGRATAIPSISFWMRSRKFSSAWASMSSPAPK